MFTKAQFLDNEDKNYHTENGVEMARAFGTEEELKLMLQNQGDHYARGHILPDEIEARRGIVNKYWKMLESVKEDEASDLYHDNVKSGKDYNDYKGIQIHNLRKELKRVRKILLNLQDIEGKDNSSDMVNDIRNMLGGYETMVDNMESAFDKLVIGRHRTESAEKVKEEKVVKCLECGKDIPASTDHASEEPYNFLCSDCRDEIGTGGIREKVTEGPKGNMEGYLNTIDEYVEILFKHRPEDMTSKLKNEIAYRIQNAVDDIRTRELGLKPSLIRANYANHPTESMSDDLKLADADRDDFRFEPNNRRHDDTLNEYSPKQIKMAFGILNDPRYRDGNYDGAYAAIEKLAKGLASHPSVAKALKRANESIIKEIDPSRSPWTLSGKHPGAMTKKELKREIAVFDELVARGDRLSPKEMMQLDSLWNYLDSDRVEEDKKKEAYHIAEKAKWIKGKREK